MMSDPIHDFRSTILSTLGFAPETIEPGRFHRFPTKDKRADSAGWCKLFPDLLGGVFGCMRSGLTQTWSALDRRTMTRVQRAQFAQQQAIVKVQREAEQRAEWARNAERISRLWSECVPLSPNDPVANYLRGRGLGDVWPLPEVLRLHRGLPYWDGDESLGTFPAMVAPIVASDGRLVALHRTYLTEDGRKANVPTVRKLTATAGPLAGACIPLWQPARGKVGIAEGIETAMAASLGSGVPTVAAYSAGNLASWRWPIGLRRLIIFADADKAGREAAEKLRVRATVAGLHCEVMTPSVEGVDWCDVWVAQHPARISERGAV